METHRSFYLRLQDFSQLIQKRFLANGIDLKEHRLTAAGGNGRNPDGVIAVLKHRHTEADPIAAKIAVPLKNTDTAPGIAAAKIAAVL